jgi:hypothetical protein
VTEVYEVVRWVNLLLASTLTLLMLIRFGGFLRASYASKMGRLVVFGWVTSTAYGTWEALHLEAVPGFRIPAVTSVLILTGYWIWVEFRHDSEERRLEAALREVAVAGIPAQRCGEPSRVG